MATYTVNKIIERASDSVAWPWEVNSGAYKGAFDDINSSEEICARTFQWEDLRVTIAETWKSKSHFVSLVRNGGDARYATISDASKTYCKLNNITHQVTEEDGTERSF